MKKNPNTDGDSLQLQEFVSQLTSNQGRIRAFIGSLMPGSDHVGDVLQEANIVLWQNRGRYRPDGNFLAWAFTIARLEVLHHRTQQKRKGLTLISNELLDMLAEEESDTGDHEAYLRALETCKSQLPESQRELIDCRYQPGRSLEEYARETGRKAPALRIALMRIRVVLRGCIEKSMEQRPA